jgi:hypothetical protein
MGSFVCDAQGFELDVVNTEKVLAFILKTHCLGKL